MMLTKPKPIQEFLEEPGQGSILLVEGLEGTAWQRFVSDGRWHSTTGRDASWDALVRDSMMRAEQNLSLSYLVYVLPPIQDVV